MIRKELIIEIKRKRLMHFIVVRLFRRRRCGRGLFLMSTLFTRRTRNRLNRNGWIATAHRHRNNQTVRRVRKCGWRSRAGVKRLRNDMTRSLDPLRAKRTRDARRGSQQRPPRDKDSPFSSLRD